MIFNVFLFLIWATDKICLSYRSKRRGSKLEKFSLLGELEFMCANQFTASRHRLKADIKVSVITVGILHR